MSKNKQNNPTKDIEPVRMAADLRRKLLELGVDFSKHKSLDRLPVDLTDVYMICAQYQCLTQKLLAMTDPIDSNEVLKILFEIEQHLFDHLSYHYKPLAKGLEQLSKVIEPDKKKREAFIMNYFDTILSSGIKNG
jgi:hypothetical protein